jgi:hypothetical protein
MSVMEVRRTSEGSVSATFSCSEALVLFDLLHRWELDEAIPADAFQDHAEERVIGDLTASLEPAIDELFSDEYVAALERARAAVRTESST